MKLKIKNSMITSIFMYLPNLQVNGRGNRARQKLLKKVADKVEEFQSDLSNIKADYEDGDEKQEEITKFIKETSILDMSEYENHMRTLFDILLDYPHEINTSTVTSDGKAKVSDALTHDYLIDVLEDAIESKQNETSDVEVV